MAKKKIAIYTATGCRACEHTLLDIHYHVQALNRWADIVFWPYVLGSTWPDLAKQPQLDVCFFSGAIRTSADREAARLLREKSKLLVACGACAAYGGLPGLANMAPAAPKQQSASKGKAEETPAALPALEEKVSALAGLVETDYLVPGCPPRQNFLWAAVQSLVAETESAVRLSFSSFRLPEAIGQAVTSGVRPPKGSIFSGERAVCASCSRVKEKKQFKDYRRNWQATADASRCLLEQGFICQGIVTREGCGGVCTAAGLPCRGCFGKTDAVLDPGVKMVSAIGSTFASDNPEELAAMVEPFVDLKGTFYRYSAASQCRLKNFGKE